MGWYKTQAERSKTIARLQDIVYGHGLDVVRFDVCPIACQVEGVGAFAFIGAGKSGGDWKKFAAAFEAEVAALAVVHRHESRYPFKRLSASAQLEEAIRLEHEQQWRELQEARRDMRAASRIECGASAPITSDLFGRPIADRKPAVEKPAQSAMFSPREMLAAAPLTRPEVPSSARPVDLALSSPDAPDEEAQREQQARAQTPRLVSDD